MEGEFGTRVNQPSVSYKHTSADYKVTISTNSRGMRVPYEVSYENNENALRVLLLGDSFAMGYGVNYEDTFSARLENTLTKELNVKTRVLNLAVSGYGTSEQYLMLVNEGIKYNPDIVISTWHSTDLKENIRSNLFKLTENKLVRASNEYLAGVKEREFLFSMPGFKFIAENSQLYSFFREKLARLIKTMLFKNRDKNSIDDNRSRDYNKLALAIIKEMEKVSSEIPAKFFILSIPDKVARGNYKETVPVEVRMEYSEDIISVSSQFEKESRYNQIYWERAQGHFTPKGTEIVAKELTNKIIASLKKPEH